MNPVKRPSYVYLCLHAQVRVHISAPGLLDMLNKTIKTPAQWGMDSSVWLVNKNTAQMELTRTRPDHQLLQTNLRFAFRCHAHLHTAHRISRIYPTASPLCIVAKHFVSLNFFLVYFCFLSFYFLLRYSLALVFFLWSFFGFTACCCDAANNFNLNCQLCLPFCHALGTLISVNKSPRGELWPKGTGQNE